MVAMRLLAWQHGFLSKADLASAIAECLIYQQQRPTLKPQWGTVSQGDQLTFEGKFIAIHQTPSTPGEGRNSFLLELIHKASSFMDLCSVHKAAWLVKCSVITVKFLVLLEQRTLRFQFALSTTNYIACSVDTYSSYGLYFPLLCVRGTKKQHEYLRT